MHLFTSTFKFTCYFVYYDRKENKKNESANKVNVKATNTPDIYIPKQETYSKLKMNS